MSRNIHTVIKSEYEKRQKAAFDNLMMRKSEVYNKIPGLEEIDNQIQLCGVKYNKMILLGTSKTEAAAELFVKLDMLKMEKERLLASSGYAADYLEAQYKCPVCKDSGFVEGDNSLERCACYKQLLISNLYSQSNLKLAENENFSSFDESYFPDATNEDKYGIKSSPRKNILEIKNRCLSFIENFSSSTERNLFFYGPTGTGKTFMANCVAYELLNAGKTVLYLAAPRLFDIIGEYKMKAFKDADFDNSIYENILNVELLIIDDLGTESPSGARYAELLSILNTRQANDLSKPCKTIISTNIGLKKLQEYYDERVVSRIAGCFSICRFAGEDIRSEKKFKQA